MARIDLSRFRRGSAGSARTRSKKGESGRRKLLRYAAYLVFYVFCFFTFAYLFFPYDRVRDVIVQEVEYPVGPGGQRRASGIELDIDELRPSFITGVNLSDVRVRKVADDPDDAPLELRLDEVSARVSLWSLMSGGIGVSYGAEIGDGEIDGAYENDETTTALEANLEGVDLASLGVLRSLIGLPVEGELSGTIDLLLSDEPADTTGTIDLTIAGLSVGDGEAKLKVGNLQDGITVEQVNAGTVTLSINVENGVGHVGEFGADGPDLELEGSGTVRLIRPIEMSRLDLLVKFKFLDSYRERNDRTRALFSLLDFTPAVRPARTPDNALQYRINGALGSRIGTTAAGRARPRN